MKTCSKCKLPKKETEFYFRTPDKTKLTSNCKRCASDNGKRSYHKDLLRNRKRSREKRRALRAANPEKFRKEDREYRRANPQISARWKKTHPDSIKNSYLYVEYGMTLDEWKRLLLEQKGVCAICGKLGKPFCVDHCHRTGKIRGLLCRKCNTAIGQLNDSLELARLAVSYLEKNLTKPEIVIP